MNSMIAAVSAVASAAVHSLLHAGTSSTAPATSVLGKRRSYDDNSMSAGSTPRKEKKNGHMRREKKEEV